MSGNEIYMTPDGNGSFESSAYTLENDALIIEEDILEERGVPLQWKRG